MSFDASGALNNGLLVEKDEVLKRRKLDDLHSENNGSEATFSSTTPDRRFRRQMVNQMQIDFGFEVHRNNPLASAARDRVLAEFHNSSLCMKRSGVQVYPNDAWLQTWTNYYKQFLTDWYDWIMVVGVVPFRIVRISSDEAVPRVPKGRFRIFTYVNPITDVQCFEYWRHLEDGEHRVVTEGDASKQFDTSLNMGFGKWYYDPSVVFHAHVGTDPDSITGKLRSKVSSIVNEVVFSQCLQLLHLQQLSENTARQPWMENMSDLKTTRPNIEGVPYAFYTRSNDPSYDASPSAARIDAASGSETQRMTTAERQMLSQQNLLDQYEQKWIQYADGAPPLGMASGFGEMSETMGAASAMLQGMAHEQNYTPLPKPLPPQMKLVQPNSTPINGGFVEQLKLSQEQLTMAYGLSRDSLSGGDSLRGNATATTKTLDEYLANLRSNAGNILSFIFRYIYMDFEVDETLKRLTWIDLEQLDEEEPARTDTSDRVFSLNKRYRDNNITITLLGPCRIEDSEELMQLHYNGVIEWDTMVTMQHQRLNLNLDGANSIPKNPWSKEDHKEFLIGRAKTETATEKPKKKAKDKTKKK